MTDCDPKCAIGRRGQYVHKLLLSLTILSNGDGIMWDFVGKDEICVQRGRFSNGNVRTLLLHISYNSLSLL